MDARAGATATAEAIVHWEAVGKVYPGPGDVPALAPTDLRIGRGEYVAIVGASGAGKSTMLNLLGLLDGATSGTYRLAGTDVRLLDEAGRAAARAGVFGFVFQSFHLLGHRTVGENTELGMLYAATPRAQRRARALEALERVGLADRAQDSPAVLSGGERQRVAIARAVAARPRVLLCDEPTGNLDSRTSGTIMRLFESLLGGGMTLVVVTHEAAVAARAARVLEVSDGVVRERA